jgi:hypothetical protein
MGFRVKRLRLKDLMSDNGDSNVAKPEWGIKRICPSCNTRYYDMKKTPPVCPSCGTQFDVEGLMKSRRGRAAPKAAPEPEEIIEDLPEAGGEEAEDAVIEDAEELGGEDVEEVVVEEEER